MWVLLNRPAIPSLAGWRSFAAATTRRAGRRRQLEVAMSIRPHYWRNERPALRALGYPIRRFKVVLHRAAERDLMFVARVVMELTRFGSAEAEFRMWEAHHRGRSSEAPGLPRTT